MKLIATDNINHKIKKGVAFYLVESSGKYGRAGELIISLQPGVENGWWLFALEDLVKTRSMIPNNDFLSFFPKNKLRKRL